ncbi:hypothetical protein VaNZ11_012659 [Volvox africanus]|uniref:Transcriptional regulatory protein n=1 Tax=Volvox africanus TaxID=51714 RepID=A0ABQ5SEE8_9CHLO|nr:hypothetical protein VaNZ11_012659 [Volvox africanus]
MARTVERSSKRSFVRQQLPLFAASPTPCPSTKARSRVLVPPVEMGRRAAKIALRKGKSDAKKSKIYGRVGKKIIQLAKAGGADPTTNAALDTLLRQAKELGVPKDVVERNLKRATDSKQGDYQEVTYEAYGPGGTGLIIFCLTDNLNRTASEVKPTVTKAGAKVAEPGSVMFNFTRCGMIVVDNTTEDAVFEAAMEAGADDVEPVPTEEDGQPSTSYKVFVPVEAFAAAKGTLRQLGYSVNEEDSDLVYKAAAPVEVDDDSFSRCEALVEKLLELDDVDNVFTNCDGLVA